MDGTNQMVRNTPVSSSTMNENRAISPSMKDQWSGNTLRRRTPLSFDRPTRSSAHLTRPGASGLVTGATFGSIVGDDGATVVGSAITGHHP